MAAPAVRVIDLFRDLADVDVIADGFLLYDELTQTVGVGAPAVADVVGLGAALDAKADVAHQHVIADVAGLQAALDAKADPAFVNSTAAGLVTLTPGTAARNLVQPTVDVVPLTTRGAAAGVANIFESQTSAGTVALSVSSAGSVGVGTAAPAYLLDVQGNMGSAVIAMINNANTLGRTELYLRNGNATSWAIRNNGSPNYQFEVLDSQNNATKVQIGRGGNGVINLNPGTGGVNLNGPLNVAPATLTRGVKVTAPVGGDFGDTGNQSFYAQNSAGTSDVFLTARGSDAIVGTTKAQAFRIETNQNARLSIDSAGNVQIGGSQTTATVPAVVRAVAAQSADILQLQDSAGAAKTYFSSGGGLTHWGDQILQWQRSFPNADAIRVYRADASTNPTVVLRSEGAVWLGAGGATVPDVMLTRTAAGAVTQQGIGAATATQSITKMVAAQTLDPIQVQTSAGAVLANINSGGSILSTADVTGHSGSVGQISLTTPGGRPALYMGTSPNRSQIVNVTTGVVAVRAVDAVATTFVVSASGSQQANNIQEWQNASFTARAYVDPNGYGNFLRFQVGAGAPATTTALLVSGNGVTDVPITAKGYAAATADLEQRQDSAGTVLSRFNAAGQLGIKGAAAPAALAGYGFIYVDAGGALRYRGPTTDTQLAVA